MHRGPLVPTKPIHILLPRRPGRYQCNATSLTSSLFLTPSF
eukprot:SAG31_NODE_44648_length_262_cov_0.613497_1_plen_40_part_01